MKPGGLEVEQAAEAAQIGIGAGPPRGAGGGRDARHQRLAGVDVDARVFVGEAVSAVVCCHDDPARRRPARASFNQAERPRKPRRPCDSFRDWRPCPWKAPLRFIVSAWAPARARSTRPAPIPKAG